MKVLFFLTNISNRGGTERTCFLVCNELAKNGFDVHLFGIAGDVDKPAYPISEMVKLKVVDGDYRGLMLLMHLPMLIFKLRSYLKTHGIDRLVSVEVMSCLFTLPLILFQNKGKRKLKFIVWEHFNYTVDLGLKLRRYFRKVSASRADAVVTLTLKDKEMWENHLSPKAKIISINNPSPFPIEDNVYSSTSRNIIAVGRLTYQKGYDILLESWNLVQKKFNFLNEEWNLFIIGDGEDKIKLEVLVKEFKLEKSVHLIANTDNIASYYKDASFLCMSSRYEGLPMVLIEAQSYGLPIVAFDCLTGPAEIVTDASGILCPALDSQKLADSIIEMTRNVEVRIEMSKKAKALASRFAAPKIFNQWKTMLESL